MICFEEPGRGRVGFYCSEFRRGRRSSHSASANLASAVKHEFVNGRDGRYAAIAIGGGTKRTLDDIRRLTWCRERINLSVEAIGNFQTINVILAELREQTFKHVLAGC